MSGAATPEEVARPLLDLAFDQPADEAFYGELVHVGHGEPGRRTIVPWQ